MTKDEAKALIEKAKSNIGSVKYEELMKAIKTLSKIGPV